MTLLLLMAGGVLGAIARFHVARLIQARVAGGFPLGTWVINISGSFGLGLLAALLVSHLAWPVDPLRIAFGVGFFAAYTTFSSFMFETVQLWRQGQRRAALLNLMSQPLLGALAALIGWWSGAIAP
jgi:fluoride exporter